MNYKIIGILSVILLAVLTLGSVCAADDNATDEVIAIEDAQDSDAIIQKQADEEQNIEDDSNQSINSASQSDDVLSVGNESEMVLASTEADSIVSVSTSEPAKLTATKTVKKLTSSKVKYKVFKGKSKYKWKIKMKTWKKMKKQAKKHYRFFRSHGSYHPGYSDSVKVTLIKNGHKYTGYAMAVRNYKGIRCEVRGLPHAERATNWGDYYPGY